MTEGTLENFFNSASADFIQEIILEGSYNRFSLFDRFDSIDTISRPETKYSCRRGRNVEMRRPKYPPRFRKLSAPPSWYPDTLDLETSIQVLAEFGASFPSVIGTERDLYFVHNLRSESYGTKMIHTGIGF